MKRAGKRNGDAKAGKQGTQETESFTREDVSVNDESSVATASSSGNGLFGRIFTICWRVISILTGAVLLESFCDRLTDVRKSVLRKAPRVTLRTDQSSLPGILKVPLRKPRNATSRIASRIDEAVALRRQDQFQPNEYVDFRNERGAIEKRPKTGCCSAADHKEALEEDPLTVHEFFKRTVERIPNCLALSCKREGVLRTWTYLDYYRATVDTAKAFIALGLEPRRGVCALGFNAPEWFFADVGAIFAGGIACGIYATNSAEACLFVIDDCRAQIVVVENDAQLAKVLDCLNKCKQTEILAVVQYDGKPMRSQLPTGGRTRFLSWADMIALGKNIPDSEVEARLNAQVPNECCTLIYTSGTTGNPKGVMLSHDNLTWVSTQVLRSAGLRNELGIHSTVSYLPLSHVAAQVVDIYTMLALGACTHFAQPDAMRGTLLLTLLDVRPTVLFGVPRVWEKFQERITEKVTQMNAVTRALFNWARGIGSATGYARMAGKPAAFGYTFASVVVFSKLRRAIGLDRCVYALSAAAPITKQTLEFFLAFDIPILEIFGMSECSAPQTINLPNTGLRITSCGRDLPGSRTVISEPDATNIGEIQIDGRNVFMGYLGMPDKNREAFTDGANSLLRSGDLGYQDKEGFLFVTGRIKELVITAGGENVPPVPIEDRIKEALPFIGNAMLIGDQRKFLSLLLTLKCELNPETICATENLARDAQQAVERLVGVKVKTVGEILDNAEVLGKVDTVIRDAIERTNRAATSRAQRVNKYKLLRTDFSLGGGELGPTLKLRRPIVHKMYKDLIDQIYSEPPPPGQSAD